jgi:hypothetical protein
MLPAHYPGLVEDQDPQKIAAAILQVLATKSGEQVRENFLARFTLERHVADLAAALRSVE